MRYFLDFDRTLFDTERFYIWLKEQPGFFDLQNHSHEEMRDILIKRMESGEDLFTSEDMRPFVYVDTVEMLRSLGNDATVVTFGNPTYQKMKVEKALVGIPRLSVLYTGSENKGTFLKDRRFLWNTDALFVDDTPEQLESVETHLPEVRLFEMRRDGEEGDGRWKVITSLSELP